MKVIPAAVILNIVHEEQVAVHYYKDTRAKFIHVSTICLTSHWKGGRIKLRTPNPAPPKRLQNLFPLKLSTKSSTRSLWLHLNEMMHYHCAKNGDAKVAKRNPDSTKNSI
jgi:hypothetical protein